MLEWVKTLGPLIVSLAWPVVAVVIALLFRRPLSNFTSLKAAFGSLSLELRRSSQEIIDLKQHTQKLAEIQKQIEQIVDENKTSEAAAAAAEASQELTQIRSSLSRLATANNNISVALTTLGLSSSAPTVTIEPSLKENPPSAED